MQNQQLLLSKIKELGPITKRELQDATGLSWGLISKLVNLLVDEGYIESYCRETESVGRKAEEFDINNHRNFFVGIDFNYRGIFVVLTDMKGRIIKQYERDFALQERTYEGALNTLFELLDTIFEQYSQQKILGIGLAMQGVVDRKKGNSLNIEKIKGWRDIPIKAILEDRYYVNVDVEHDPECLMKSESVFGCMHGRGIQDAILVSISHRTGLGMAIMVHGDVYYGANGKAGEIGYSIVKEPLEGFAVYLQDYVLKEDILLQYKELVQNDHDVTYMDIEERAKAGDLVCRDIYKRMGRNIGYAITSACVFLNPEMVVVHATTCGCADLMFAEIDNVVSSNVYDSAVKIKMSTLSNDAVALGGALTAIEHAMQEI